MRRRPLATTAIALTLLATAIAPTTVAAQADRAAIEGPQWQLVTYRDESGELPLVPPGIGVTMVLFSGSVFGEGACSDYKGDYSLAGQDLQIFPPDVTPRSCDPATQRVDDAFYAALAGTGNFSIDGSALQLNDIAGDTVATFTEARVPADPTIAPWRLERIAGADGSSDRVIEGSLPTFRFLPGGRLIGDTGCGSFLGSWETLDSQMIISDVAFRLQNCTNDLDAQANVILSTLQEITDFTVRPAGLSLEDNADTARLALVPDIKLADRNWGPIATFDGDGEVALTSAQLPTASVRFSRNSVTGRTPCPRDYVGGNQRSGLAVTIFDLTPDSEGCRRLKIERSFLASLGRVASHALRGDELELLDVDGRPVVRLVAQPGLRDVPWRVVQLDSAPGARRARLRAPAGGAELTADFGESGLLTGTTGRTTFDGFYDESGGATIEVTETRASISGCTGGNRRKPECRVENGFLNLLKDVDGYEIRTADSQLVLLNGQRHSIVLEPALGNS